LAGRAAHARAADAWLPKYPYWWCRPSPTNQLVEMKELGAEVF
jgi:hypothetical protein